MTTKTTKRKRKHPRPIRRKPQTGWTLIAYGDLEEVDPLHLHDVVCDACNRPLRYYNVIAHEDWPDEMVVGNGCCERLTEDG